MASAAPPAPGWYGKIPALGDFASRRLPAAFISQWDAWLQQGMAASRASLGERWLDLYLNGPLWNFALLPGVCGDSAWAGTMMPSVDKVGRHFPLTIAVELESHPALLGNLLSAREWFAGIQEAALECLDLGFDPALLEARLAACPYPHAQESREQEGARRLDRSWADPAASSMMLVLPARQGIVDLFHQAGLHHYGINGHGKSLWWSEAPMAGTSLLQTCSGMPHAEAFAAFLSTAG